MVEREGGREGRREGGKGGGRLRGAGGIWEDGLMKKDGGMATWAFSLNCMNVKILCFAVIKFIFAGLIQLKHK